MGIAERPARARRGSPAASGSGSPSPRALSAEPAILLADEPTGNLDAETGEGIIRLFAELAGGGLTVLVVTHEERVSRAASRVLHLHEEGAPMSAKGLLWIARANLRSDARGTLVNAAAATVGAAALAFFVALGLGVGDAARRMFPADARLVDVIPGAVSLGGVLGGAELDDAARRAAAGRCPASRRPGRASRCGSRSRRGARPRGSPTTGRRA